MSQGELPRRGKRGWPVPLCSKCRSVQLSPDRDLVPLQPCGDGPSVALRDAAGDGQADAEAAGAAAGGVRPVEPVEELVGIDGLGGVAVVGCPQDAPRRLFSRQTVMGVWAMSLS